MHCTNITVAPGGGGGTTPHHGLIKGVQSRVADLYTLPEHIILGDS